MTIKFDIMLFFLSFFNIFKMRFLSLFSRVRNYHKHEMKSHDPEEPVVISWVSLPLDVRATIFDIITTKKYCGWASLAAVSKEWQQAIEKKNFHRLKLGVSCLDSFQNMVVRPRDLVHHIQLHIELKKCPRSCCQ